MQENFAEDIHEYQCCPIDDYIVGSSNAGNIYVWRFTATKWEECSNRADSAPAEDQASLIGDRPNGGGQAPDRSSSPGAPGDRSSWSCSGFRCDPVCKIAGHPDAMRAIQFSPDGARLVSASTNGEIKVCAQIAYL